MGTFLLILGLLAVFGGLALVLMSIGVVNPERSGVSRSLAVIAAISQMSKESRAQVEPTFKERVALPALDRFVEIGRRFTPQDRIARLVHRMELAGMPQDWTIDRILAGKVLGSILAAGAGVLYGLLLGKLSWLLVLGIGGAAVGWFLPEIVLHQKAYNRSKQLQRALPDTLDLLTISVEAGMGFDAAMANVGRNSEGPLADEFRRVLHEMQLGNGRTKAMRALADRTDVPDLRIFVNAIVQADEFGLPIGNVLRTQAKEMRTKRSQRAEEQAMKIPVKMIFPLILCILPTLMIVIIGPAVINIYQNFMGAV